MNGAATQQLVDDFLSSDAIPLGPEYPCPYLPERQARHRGFVAARLDPEVYHALMNRGYRRSGEAFYQPRCAGCGECVQLRLGIEEFAPSRSQRRVWRANNDVTGRVGSPDLTSEKWHLYRRYLAHQHDGTMSDNYEDLYNFLYRSPVHTIEVCYELSGRLIGVSLADQSRHSLSSVYMYFDPDHAGRSLGTFSMLWEIDYCRRMIIPYYYLGFYVRNCGKMSYKANFRPHQLLAPDHRWIPGQP